MIKKGAHAMRYDDYDDRYDGDICEEDVRETLRGLEALNRDYSGRKTYVRSVDRVFYDIFGFNGIGSIFAMRSRNRRDDNVKIEVFNRCGSKRLIDMILDDRVYYMLQNLVQLHHDMSMASKSKDRDDAAIVYTKNIERIKKMFGIKNRSHIGNLGNPLKNLKKISRDYDDDYGFYDDDDEDYYYRDYDRDYYDYDRRERRSRRSRRDDYYDYDDSDFVSSILKDVDPDVIRRRPSKGKKRRKSDSRSVRDDYDDEEDDDFESVTADTFKTIAASLEKINNRIDNLESNSYDDDCGYDSRSVFSGFTKTSPSKRNDELSGYNTDDSGLRASIDALARSVRSIANSQAETREDLNNVIDIIKEAAAEDDEDTIPPNSGGDLLKTTGGVGST